MQAAGIPYTENIRTRRGMRLFAELFVRIFISGYLDRWSMIMNTYVPLDNGPKKPILTVCETVLRSIENVIDVIVYYVTTGSKSGVLYGLSKVHKNMSMVLHQSDLFCQL